MSVWSPRCATLRTGTARWEPITEAERGMYLVQEPITEAERGMYLVQEPITGAERGINYLALVLSSRPGAAS
eukprot:9467239-Pyramimonas_sp.AAC.1